MSASGKNRRKGGGKRMLVANETPSESQAEGLTQMDADFLKEITQKAPALERLPKPQQIELIRTLSLRLHASNLPPPEELSKYSEAMPGGAERVFSLIEAQAKHRMDLEQTVLKVAPQETARAQRFALFVGLAALAISAFVASLGMETAAGTTASVALGTLALGFLKMRK